MRYFLLVILIISPLFIYAQTILKGVVKSKTENKAINGVVVTVTNDNQDVLGYNITDSKGFYQIEINTQEKDFILNVSSLGYATKTITIPNQSQTTNIDLHPSEIQLKEIVIKSKVMWNKEDTLVYSVGAFKSQQDRTIGDILKKLPGIEVSQNGGIKYNGEPINKFYIEGLDLLDRKYGIATNNVPVDAVTNVEVIENHQPVKTLKDLMGTGQAAINLKLKNNKMIRPVGTAKVGVGGAEDFLWDINAFALQANKQRQAIIMYKTNNTGNDIAAELTEHSLSYEALINHNKPITSILLNRMFLNSPPLEKERYLFNKTHIATLNNLWKTGEDSQLRINANYIHDKQDESIYQSSSYFLPDGDLYINELKNTDILSNYIDGIITYTDNSSGHYLNNTLKGQGKWNKTNSIIENTNRISQHYSTPEYSVSNELKYAKKWNNRLWEFSSFVRYSSLPQTLTVNNDTLNFNIFQKVNHNGLYTNNKSNMSFSKGNSRLYLNLNVEGYIENLNSDLSNHPLLTNNLYNDINSNYLKVAIEPSYSFRKNKVEFSIDVPITYHFLEIKDKYLDKNQNDQFLYLDPQITLTYKISQLWQTSLSYRYTHNIGDITDFTEAYIITDYRTANIKSGILQKRESQSVSLRANFRNPLTTLFFNTAISYTSSKRNLLNQQSFINRQSVISNAEQNNRYEMWVWRGYIGKYFGDIQTSFSLSANCILTKSRKSQQGILVPMISTTWNVTPKVNTKIHDAVSLSYQAEIINNRLKIKTSPNTSNSSTYQISQKLTGHYFLNNKIELNTQLEYLYNEITKDLSFDLLFANIGAKYKHKDMEYTISLNNIFNKKEYSYTIYNALDTYSYNYKLRPLNILTTVSFKF